MIKKASFFISLALSAMLSTTVNATQNDKNKLPNIGAAGGSILSLEKERLIGNAMMKHLRASSPILHDPVLNEYINDLGNGMVKYAKDVHYGFEFFIIRNQEINAFAFFGGHIGIHSGLITTAETESELASVIAHEISHVTQRHLARRLESQSRNQPLTMAGMISGVLLALVNPTVGMAAISTSMAASQQASINYTRGNEQEADRVGITLLADSGFDPNAAPAFFSKMAEKYRYTSKPPAMLLTHPLPESRIADARIRAQNMRQQSVAPSKKFSLAKARIEARYENNARDNILRFQSKIDKKQYAYKEAVLYGLALSYFEDNQFDKAHDILMPLLNADDNNLFYVDLMSDVLIKQERFDRAIAMLSGLNLLMPNNQVVALNYANVLKEAGQYEQSEVILQDYLLLNPDSFIAHDLLTTVYRKQNKTALMHMSKAEVFGLLGAYSKAVDELQTGYNFAKDMPLAKKRIRAKILQFQDQENKLKRLN